MLCFLTAFFVYLNIQETGFIKLYLFADVEISDGSQVQKLKKEIENMKVCAVYFCVKLLLHYFKTH